MNIQKMDIADLNAAKYNPRKKLKPGDAEFEKLKRSIESFGVVEPPIFNIRTKTVVGGHQRLAVMKMLGYTETDVVVVDISEAEEKALNVALNKISGEWDELLLTDLMSELRTMGFDTELTGFSMDEVEKMFNGDGEVKAEKNKYDPDEAVKEPPFVLRGDLWRLKNHRLLVGDSTNAADVARLMDGKKANLLLTDFPYNVNYEGKAGKIQNDNMSQEDFYKFLLTVFTNVEAVMDDEASCYIFHSDTNGEWFRRAFREAGFKLSGVCQWVKPSLVLGRSPYQWQNEPVLFGWKAKGKHKWYAGRAETTIWNFDKTKKNNLHPTMKPLDLLAYPLKNSTAANAIVLDVFSGSFSTGMTCEQLNRVCYAMEIDERYASASIKRFIAEYGADGVTVERNGKILTFTEVTENG
ncbi:adenine methyltransferase [Clostridia bacterium]|nr:adenine methyltransferase [Clostridia bacterium]